MRSRPPRLVLAPLVVVAALLIPGTADGGTYTISNCYANQGGNGSWQPLNFGGNNFTVDGRCGRTGFDPQYGGFFARTTTSATTIPYNQAAGWLLSAPAGNTFVAMSWKGWWETFGSGLAAELDSDRGDITGCSSGSGYCNSFLPPSTGNGVNNSTMRNATAIISRVRCTRPAGCPTTGRRADATSGMYDVEVVVEDPNNPQIPSAGGSLWWSSGTWVRGGGQEVSFDATDSSGIRRNRILLDGAVLSETGEGCDWQMVVPCPVNRGLASGALNTAAWTDGAHTLTVEAMDAAGNTAQVGRTIRVDNTAPAAPADLAASPPGRWTTRNSFLVSWTNPGQGNGSPLVASWYRLCRVGGTECREQRASAPINSMSDFRVPGVGKWTIQTAVEDTVGYRGPWSAAVELWFDDTVPAEATLPKRNGWVGKAEAARFDQLVLYLPSQAVPPSGLAGYSITTDGSVPDATVELSGFEGQYRVARSLPQGVTILKARSVSGAGVPASVTTQVEIRVDLTDPTVTVTGAPDPGSWQSQPVRLTVRGQDQPGLSGMESAEPDDPIEKGGYVSWRIDGGPERRQRGSVGELELTEDGAHTVNFWATDAAGNVSAEATAQVRVDRSPPETVVFTAREPADPARVAAVVGDRASGVVGGQIEYRAWGEADWRPLGTALQDGLLVARVDDAALPDGRYELRARVRDAAGNEAVGERTAAGTGAGFSIPLRLQTSLLAAAERVSVKRTCRRVSVKRRSRRPVRRRVCRSSPPKLTRRPTARVRHGGSTRLFGLLTTAGGEPVAGADVTVTEQPLAAGAEPVRVGAVRTDERGELTYTAPAGPSRTVAFSFAGNLRLRRSGGQARLLVPAAIRFRLPPRAVNGDELEVSGRVLGGFIPPGGKLVEVQYFARGRYRTFMTTNTDATGRWRIAYMFGTVTQGKVPFRMRAVVPREAAYPFEPVASRRRVIVVSAY